MSMLSRRRPTTNLSSCPTNIKAQCYKTLVRPILEYPHTKTNIQTLEAVQRWATRFATGDYRTTSSTSQMISRLGWESLQHRKTTARIVMMYRVTHHLIDIPVAMLSHPATLITRGHNICYLVLYCKTDVYRHFFFPAGIRLWNQLTECIVTSPNSRHIQGRVGHSKRLSTSFTFLLFILNLI